MSLSASSPPTRSIPQRAEVSSSGSSAACEKEQEVPVGQTLTDDQREEAIRIAAGLVEKHMAAWEKSGCFADRGNADRARVLMEQLIRGRSPEYVARIERERGLL
jgi:hypothetical protein